jgi:hypothetical protein
MSVDLNIGVGDAGCRMEQGDGCAQYGRVVGHGQRALLSTVDGVAVYCGSRTAARVALLGLPTRLSFQSL